MCPDANGYPDDPHLSSPLSLPWLPPKLDLSTSLSLITPHPSLALSLSMYLKGDRFVHLVYIRVESGILTNCVGGIKKYLRWYWALIQTLVKGVNYWAVGMQKLYQLEYEN